ncbi:MAG: SDR family oxidoreductase [Anaerolineaceae bacterium]|nr:SDR family oxidoreductase [Anaerolineaceae bacterium]
MFSLEGKVAVVTGGAGVLCGAMSVALAQAGAKVAVLDLRPEKAQEIVDQIRAVGGEAIALACNVLEKSSIEAVCQEVLANYGKVDILINGAGGNHPKATTNAEQNFFDLPADAVRSVFDLNFQGTLLPSQVFGVQMAKQGEGVILNVSSMNAFRPLTRIPAYSAAKAAVSNFTQWLAAYLAMEYSPKIRVNAIAPGFFLTDQNRFLVTEEATGNLTPRGKTIVGHTPAGRLGAPEDLLGTVLWLVSPASAFVTGVVVPVDGGFNGFSGV